MVKKRAGVSAWAVRLMFELVFGVDRASLIKRVPGVF